MKKIQHIIIYIIILTLVVGCGGHENGHVPQPSDTLYTIEKAREVFHQDPERALTIIDSAEMLGTANHTEATVCRARFYSNDEATLDTARTLCVQLLAEDDLTIEQRTEVLDVLVYVSRLREDDEGILKYGMQYAEVCRQLDNEAEALLMQSEMGESLIRLGRTDEGFAKMDDAIAQLDKLRRFAEFDACVRAMKSKIRSLDYQKRYEDIIPVAERIVEKMSDYSKYPTDYDDGSNRMPTEERRPGYIDWYTGQAYAFMAYAYAMQADNQSTPNTPSNQNILKAQAKHCLALFDQTDFSHTRNGKMMISSTWCLLGEYDKMLAFYDELEPLWGGDTLHINYAIMLRDRATAARHQGRMAQAYDYMQRYSKLLKTLNDSERLATAQEYAARYHEQEQQLALEQEQAAKHRMAMIIIFLGILTLMAFVFIIINLRQLRNIRQKNAVLSKEISERIDYEEKYLSLMGSRQRVTDSQEKSDNGDHLPANNFQLPDQLEEFTDHELFDYIRKIISDENLHLDPQFGREQLVERLQLTKERIGAAFAQGSEYPTMKHYLTDARLFHSTKLLSNNPEMSITEVALASGFTSIASFSHSFRERFAMTPSEFRNKTDMKIAAYIAKFPEDEE